MKGIRNSLSSCQKGSERYLATARGITGQEQRQVEMLESGVRQVVEARREGRVEERRQDRNVRFEDAQDTDEQDAMSGLEEMRTAGESQVSSEVDMRGFKRTRQGNGKGEGYGGKGEHGSKGTQEAYQYTRTRRWRKNKRRLRLLGLHTLLGVN